jgi:formylglycine-generating enzyme required for sulfatase activity
VTGDVHTQGGDFIGRNQYRFEYRDQPPRELLQAYYRCLAQDCGRLPLGVVDPQFVPTGVKKDELSLTSVYTDLDVVAVPRQQDEAVERWGLRLARAEGGERTPVLTALADARFTRLALLGDPGSGKTTFVNYLTLLLATAMATGTRPALPDSLKGLIPVRLVLRNAVRHLSGHAEQGTGAMLWEALRADIEGHLGKPAAERLFPHLQDRVLKQPGLFLLDGLDEVPEAEERRRSLLEAIKALAASLPAGSRLLLTARPYAYADPKWQLPGFELLALAPFSPEQVRRFVEHWYAAVAPVMGWEASTAEARAQRLAQVLLKERPELADLASRPLLLTLIATLHTSWGQLPEDRADLYEESVKLLLSRWQRGREVRGADGAPVQEPSIARALSLDESVIRSALERLAFRTHEQQARDTERRAGAADITRGEVLEVFEPRLPADLNPGVLLHYLDTRAGLLIGRHQGVYAFPHRSFQEYLAACHLANTEPEFASRLRALVWEDPAWWWEVFLLGVGKKRQGGLGDAVNVVNTLVPQSVEAVRDITRTHWKAVVLAGEALLALRLPEKATGQPHFEAVLDRLRGWLRRLVETGQLAPRERLTAGDVLGRLGDPRKGVGVRAGKRVSGSIPDIDWVAIPAGPFVMGSREDDRDAYEGEKPAHTLELPAFYIARYPVTHAQYRPFVEAGGYEDPRWWTEEGWAWRGGAEADLSGIDDEDLRRRYAEWLAGRPRERRDRPFGWEDPRWGAPNRPVVGITWHETLAYCRWLEAVLWDEGADFSALGGAAWRLSLPSEAQWEKAARGPKGRHWPWGNTWAEDRTNTAEVGLQETSSVGLFPKGKSPYRVLDLAGNVWEWTTSRWGRKISEPDYRYPYEAADGREDLSGSDLRVVRGGSWDAPQGDARCAARGGFRPVDFHAALGFRVVVSLADSGF